MFLDATNPNPEQKEPEMSTDKDSGTPTTTDQTTDFSQPVRDRSSGGGARQHARQLPLRRGALRGAG